MRHPLTAQLSLCPASSNTMLLHHFPTWELLKCRGNFIPYKPKSPKVCEQLNLPFQQHPQFLSSAGEILKRQADCFLFPTFHPLVYSTKMPSKDVTNARSFLTLALRTSWKMFLRNLRLPFSLSCSFSLLYTMVLPWPYLLSQVFY